jgi:hypothetical protein
MLASETELTKTKSKQKEKYDQLISIFVDKLAALLRYDNKSLVTSSWWDRNKEHETKYSPPIFDFIMAFASEMFPATCWAPKKELEVVEESLELLNLDEVAEEDLIGDPGIAECSVVEIPKLTSWKTLQSLYQIAYLKKLTGFDARETSIIIEWGGGYGNMAKNVWRIKKSPLTYIMIDTPFFCCLQWLYLSCIFGPESIHLIEESDKPIVEGMINILPCGMLQDYSFTGDLFIALWSLSESSQEAQQMVLDRDWFGAPHILFSYQLLDERFPTSPWLADQLRATRENVYTDQIAPFAAYAIV